MNDDERYIPIEQSIIDSFKEIKEMRAGKTPKRTDWHEMFAEIRQEIDEEERLECQADRLKYSRG